MQSLHPPAMAAPSMSNLGPGRRGSRSVVPGIRLEALGSPREGPSSPGSPPSSIREVVLDSQRLLRSGAGGLLHRVTQAFQ